jgi:hypothetical protein
LVVCAVAGVALATPGLIDLLSWPDTLRAFAPAIGESLGPFGAGFCVVVFLQAPRLGGSRVERASSEA